MTFQSSVGGFPLPGGKRDRRVSYPSRRAGPAPHRHALPSFARQSPARVIPSLAPGEPCGPTSIDRSISEQET